MLQLLQRPVLLLTSWSAIAKRYFLIGLFVALFLMIFQPFGTAGLQMSNKLLFLSGYGWITFLSMTAFFGGIPRLFPSYFQEESWLLWKQILFLTIALSICFLCCYLYMNFWFGWKMSFQSLFGFYGIALAIAITPVIILSLVEYIYYLKNNQAFAESMNQQMAQPNQQSIKPANTMLDFKGENQKEDFSIPLDQLLFIKAANNYVEINYLEENQVKKHLLRNSIRNIEQQITAPAVKRCHRSYMVNMDKVGRMTGNAQGYKLHFPFTAEYIVPVSRSKGKELMALLTG